MNITISEVERKLFNLLLQVAKEKAPTTQLRAAGGWVRDKLMGIESHDIDIVVDNISGQEFAQHVLHYMLDNNIYVQHDLAVVKANPDKSKHLETTILPIFGVAVDFVQFRKEVYHVTDGSRIPKISTENVTAEEDASRRDFTVNALFFNLQSESIEDFCNGMKHLKEMKLTTPLDAHKTFVDDPLRILRAIRFASKYNFEVDGSLIEAARSETVQKAFKNKISPERIWREMAGIFESEGFKKGFLLGPNPVRACQLMKEMGIRDLLFTLNDSERELLGVKQDETSHWDQDQNSKYHNLTVWDHTLCAMGHLVRIAQEDDIDAQHPAPEIEQLVRMLSVLFHDVGKCDLCSRQVKEDGTFGYNGHAESSAKIAEYFLNTRLKAPKEIVTRVKAMAQNHMRIHHLEKPSKAVLRRILRDMGDDWKNLIYHSLADALGKIGAEEDPKYRSFVPKFFGLKVENGGENKPKRPIDGHVVMATLGLNPGKQIKIVMDALDEALLENPAMTSNEAIELIRTIQL